MADPARLFILAGEASGDRIGAALLEGLKRRREIAVTGVGGDDMAASGLPSLFPMSDLSVMGYVDVIARLPLLLWRLRQVTRHILRTQPDCVVLIDAQVFSETVAARLRKRGFIGRIVLYVAPSVWAYRPERAAKIAPLYDEVLAVLPFEPEAMRRLCGPPTVYVGHPALERFAFRTRSPARGPLMLMPGSRGGELRRHLPLMREVAARLANHPSVDGVVIPTPAALNASLTRQTADWPVPVKVVSDTAARQQALETAVAAFAVSGTATLELALAGVPHAITYVAEPAQVKMFENGQTRWIGLPNILAGHEVVPEVLFAGNPDPDRATAIVRALLDSSEAREDQRSAFTAIRQLMAEGSADAPLLDATERIVEHLPDE